MILIAAITGMPDSTLDFFKAVKEAEPSYLFESFIYDYVAKHKENKDLLNLLITQMNKDPILEDLSNITMDKFQTNLELVSRFTFRNLTYA